MYLDFFGLKEKPFSLTPDPRFLFLSESHRQALDHMLYGIREREGFILIIGDIGTGKTTICRELLEKLEPGTASALLLNPMLSESELLEAILQDFGILDAPREPGKEGGDYHHLYENLDPETQTALELNPLMPAGKVLENIMSKVDRPAAAPGKKELIDRLNTYLLARAEEGGNAVLLIDEAQNLSLPVLEQIRILSNLETPRQKLLQIVLVGQLELKRKLEQPGLRQLNQRISVRYQIKPMTLDESKRYVEHRLFVAGSNAAVAFSDRAHEAIFEFARGVPRLINVIAERCMLGAFVDQVRRIEPELVERCRQSLESNLDQEAGPEIPTSAATAESSTPTISSVMAAAAKPETEAAPEDSVTQPWERENKAGRGRSKRFVFTMQALMGLIVAGLLGYRFYSRPFVAPPQASGVLSEKAAPAPKAVAEKAPSAPAAANEAADQAAVPLSYSIQVGAFQDMNDGLEQMRLLTEQGLKEGLYIVPLHLVQLGGRWYRLFYGGFPSPETARSELMRLVEKGTLSAGSARILETPLAFKLGVYDSRDGAEKDRLDYLSRFQIPTYALELQGGNSAQYCLYAGAFEERDQSTYLADRLDKAGLHGELVERAGLWQDRK